MDEFLTSVANSFLWGRPGFRFAIASRHEQVFASVVTVQALVDNGGLAYLFESSLEGDPDYQFSASAFKEIDATETHDAFVKALRLYGVPFPLGDRERRRKWREIEVRSAKVVELLDQTFWRNSDGNYERLAKFARGFWPETRESQDRPDS